MVDQTQQVGASFNPEDFGQGGLFDALLTIKSGLFQHNTFTPTEGPNAGQEVKNLEAKITYTKEDGNDAEWTYSVGPADSWNPSKDGLSAVPIKDGGKISQSSAFGTFLFELLNAGFPGNRMSSGRLDALFGTQFQSQGVVRKGAEAGSKQVLSAKLVVGVPGEVAGGNTASVATPPVPPTPSAPAVSTPPPTASNGAVDVGQLAMTSALNLKRDTFTLQDVMAQVMQDLASDPSRDAAAGHVFTPEFTGLLQGAGYTVSQYNVSK